MIKILMIEDDLELAEILTEFLAKSDMSVTTAEEPYIGLSTLNVEKFDLVILDLTLPGLDGLEVCKEIRKRHDVPIIISSARHDITDKVNALDNGADDYLPKPYDPQELLARIKSHLRRQSAVAGANLLKIFCVDTFELIKFYKYLIICIDIIKYLIWNCLFHVVLCAPAR